MSNRKKAARPPAELDRRGLVEVFLTEDDRPTQVLLVMYPPGRPSVSVEMQAAEAVALGNALLDGAGQAEKWNTNAGRT